MKVKRPLRWLKQLICRISAAENWFRLPISEWHGSMPSAAVEGERTSDLTNARRRRSRRRSLWLDTVTVMSC